MSLNGASYQILESAYAFILVALDIGGCGRDCSFRRVCIAESALFLVLFAIILPVMRTPRYLNVEDSG